MTNPSPNSVELPAALRQQFEVLERRLWRVDTIIAVCGALGGLVLSYTLLFISDRFWDTPAALRALFTALGLGVAAYFILFWVRHWVWNRRDSRALATLVQRHYPRLGDNLLGIVELADGEKRPANVSEELCRAAIEQVSGQAIRYDFKSVISLRKANLCFAAATLLAAVITLSAVRVPDASWNAFVRWIWPGSKVERFTFVSIDKLPSNLVVPHGEPFEIAFQVGLHEFWKPQGATAQYDQQPALQSPIEKGGVVFRIPGQTKSGALRLRIGDVAKRIAVQPEFRPALKQQVAQVKFPDYLEHPPASEEIRTATFTFLEGSRVSFKGKTSRELKEAKLEVVGLRGAEAKPEAASVKADEFHSAPLALDGLAQISFTWRDRLNLGSAAPWKLSLQSKKDLAPEADCPEQAAVIAILPEEVVEIKTAAQDDFGLRQLSVVWDVTKRNETNTLKTGAVKLTDGAPQSKALNSTFKFSPIVFGIPADSVVNLRAAAADYFPGRRPTESPSYRIYVLSREDHARLVQQQFEKLMGELDDIARREEGLLEAAKELKEMKPEQLQGEEAAKKLERQANEQNNIAEKLNDIAKQGNETLREAMRNNSIPTDQLKEWAKAMEQMKNLANQKMAQASKSLSNAQQQPGQRSEKVDEAVKTEQEILNELQEMQKKGGKNIDAMQANTLALRLRKIADYEKEVAGGLTKAFPELAGTLPDKLPEKQKNTIQSFANGQTQNSKESFEIQTEISRFFDRTSVTNYGNVAKEMKESDVVENLNKNSDLIRQNVAMKAIKEAETMGKQFTKWAEQLEAINESGGGGGGGGGGGEDKALERLMGILRARQAEDALRKQTETLEQQRAQKPAAKPEEQEKFTGETSKLSDQQLKVMRDVQILKDEDPGEFLGDAQKAMSDAEQLLGKSETGKKTVASETDAINLLDAEVASMMKKGKASPQMVQMMMQMMGMGQQPGQQPAPGQGNSPGMSSAGGTTDKPNVNVPGSPNGAKGDPRTTKKVAGRARTLPTEYRDALQDYFKAIEQKP